MKRYLNSFLITLVLYSFVIFALFVVLADEKILLKKEKTLQQTISLQHIELIPLPKIEKKVEKPKELIKEIVKKQEPKKIKPKKILKKKIVKKKIIEKPKKVMKRKSIKKKETKVKKIEKQVQKEPIKQEVIKKIVKEKTTNTKKPKKVVKTDIKKDYLSKHLRMIRKQIKQNIRYPKSAKRLKIQGIVNIKFTLRSNGLVDNIVILNGHSRLKKSTIDAVKDAASSFPKVKKDITIQLPIEYKLI